jgi:AraC-like DNA-binding protein
MSTREHAATGRQALVEQARAIMRSNLHNPHLSLNEIAAQLYISRRHLQRAFAEGGSPGYRHELFRMRVRAGAVLIARHPDRPIEEIARAVGYLDSSQFAKSFRRQFGRSPRQWRSQCRLKRAQQTAGGSADSSSSEQRALAAA